MTISTLNTKIATSENARHFMRKCVQKFGVEKVKEFMELQLLHHNELSL